MHEFRELYEKYNRTIYVFLLKLSDHNADAAEELTQETFYQAYLNFHKYRGESGILTWLCGIAKNVYYKYCRKHPVTITLNDGEAEKYWKHLEMRDLQDMVETKEQIQLVLRELARLSPKDRDVITYRIFFELPFKEIATIMKIKENSAKVLYHRAKMKIRKRMERDYEK